MNTENMGQFTLEQKKTAYNLALEAARDGLRSARAIRGLIEAEAPRYIGRTREKLAIAEQALFTARTFANTPGDLPEAENSYR